MIKLNETDSDEELVKKAASHKEVKDKAEETRVKIMGISAELFDKVLYLIFKL